MCVSSACLPAGLPHIIDPMIIICRHQNCTKVTKAKMLFDCMDMFFFVVFLLRWR